MTMTNTQKWILVGAIIVLCGGIFFTVRNNPSDKYKQVSDTPDLTSEEGQVPVVLDEVKPATPPLVVNPGPKEGQEYYNYTMTTTNAQKELSELVGEDNVMAVLQTNRIDSKNIKSGASIVIPTTFDSASRSPFPLEFKSLSEVPKILLFNQRVQAFAAYESGKLVRWGPLSSGKQSTKTPNGLFSTNWKGKEIKSSFDDEWILKYNFNIQNFEGIGFHQYEMPGYPASHSCLRLHLEDAMWLYEWADQWVLSGDEQTRLAHGTPVIVFGDYAFGKTAPWKLLPENPEATDIPLTEMNALIEKHVLIIKERKLERETVVGTVG